MSSVLLLKELEALSAQVGSDPVLVQGGGGNSSIKIGDVMWVKASGKWLADAEKENIFVKVRYKEIVQSVQDNKDDPVTAAIEEEQQLRPSIETTLHALLPHKVVLHVHSVNTIVYSVQVDGAIKLAKLLDGIDWAWVPYAKPGISLTQAVSKAIEDKHPDVLVLANHGLVVAADTVKNTKSLLDAIESRLNTDCNEKYQPQNNFDSAVDVLPGYRLPSDPRIQDIAVIESCYELARKGILYPDHVVFLGKDFNAYQSMQAFTEASKLIEKQQLPVYCCIEGFSIIVREDISLGAEAMLLCWALVLRRLPDNVTLNYLTAEQLDELINWEAEKYRQKIAK